MTNRPPALRHSPPGRISQLSPRILTPDEAMHPPHAETFSFVKQPLPQVHLGIGSGEYSDSAWSDDLGQASKRKSSPIKPVSLLSTLLHSPDQQSHNANRFTAPATKTSSSQPSALSTAVSSPNGQLGILQKDTASILRRGSTSASSDGHETPALGLGLGVANGGLEGLVGRLERVDETRERVGWADEVAQREVSAVRGLG
jgi:hypothetical protein